MALSSFDKFQINVCEKYKYDNMSLFKNNFSDCYVV